MKKILIYGGATLLLIILSALLFIQIGGIPSYAVGKPTIKLKTDSATLATGKKYVSMLCASCHMNAETRQLTGRFMSDAPKEFGVINSPNITQDKTYGIGEWTPSEILYLLRTGIKRDGQYAPPYMAKLPTMSDADITAIISFLKSDDPMVAAAAVPDKPVEPSFLTKMLTRVVFKPFKMPATPILVPDSSDAIELGGYLARNLECFSCHSADFKTNDFLHPDQSEGYFGGGNKPLNHEGQVMPTPNLTPDKTTGIGSWSQEKFVKALKTGIVEGQPALRYPMAPYTQLTDREAAAIYQYLMSIPPISNKVDRAPAK